MSLLLPWIQRSCPFSVLAKAFWPKISFVNLTKRDRGHEFAALSFPSINIDTISVEITSRCDCISCTDI